MTDHVARLDGLNLALPFSRPVTAEEWNGIQWPPCPKCGATICVDRVDVTAVSDLLRQYVAGRWECPNECDPRAADETRSLIQGFARARRGAFPERY